MKRINLILDNDVYCYLMYRKGTKHNASVPNEMRKILAKDMEEHPIDKTRYRIFLESNGLETDEMKEERRSKEKRIEKLDF